MKPIQKLDKFAIHQTAGASHYDESAKNYDAYNEENSMLINKSIERVLKKHKIKTVLDLTCGTGSQVFWLKKRGFDVTGADINLKMLRIAKSKAKSQKLHLRFLQGDMRTLKAGNFDAAITIFNAVGHLTKQDFEKAMRNIYSNLKSGGLYIFDICNLDYFLQADRITRLTIDWQKTLGNRKIRTIQYSTIDEKGILASYTTCYEQHGARKPNIAESAQTLQIYSAKQLMKMSVKTGFKIINQIEIDGSKFDETDSERILTVAMKI